MKSFKKNVDFYPYKPPSHWRKVSIGTWRRSGDPSVYAFLDVDATAMLKQIEEHKVRGIHLTPTTVCAKALALAIKSYPAANSIIRLGRPYMRKTIDIFLQVGVKGDGKNIKEDLSGIVIRKCDEKNLETIAEEIQHKAAPIKKGKDKSYDKAKKTMKLIPGFFLGFVLDCLAFILYDLNIWIKSLGVPKDSFGSAMVSSVGNFDVERALGPLIPYSRAPLVVLLGKVSERAVVEDGKVVVKPMVTLGVTLDHRFVDGVGGGIMIKALKDYMASPY